MAKFSKHVFLLDIFGQPIKQPSQKRIDPALVGTELSPEVAPNGITVPNAGPLAEKREFYAAPTPEYITCHDVIIDIVLNAFPKGSLIPNNSKYFRAEIALKITAGKDSFDLKENEIKFIKILIDAVCDPLPAYNLWNYLDNPIKSALTVVDGPGGKIAQEEPLIEIRV